MPDFTDIVELDPSKDYFVRFPSDLSGEEIRSLVDTFEQIWKQRQWTGSIILVPDNIEISDETPD